MKKKGFTLIELLAVIVILAIIALIATPLVLKYIETARTNSKITSTKNYIKAVENTLASYSITNKGKSYPEGCYEISTLNTDLDISMKGDLPSEGTICIEDNKIEKGIVKYPDNKIIKYEDDKTTVSDEVAYESFNPVSNYIIDEDLEFAYDESAGGYMATLPITKEIADKFIEATDYDLIIDNSEIEILSGSKESSLLVFYPYGTDMTKAVEVSTQNIKIFSQEELVGVHNVKIGNPRPVKERIYFWIVEGGNMGLVGWDFINGPATLLIKDETGVEYFNDTIEFTNPYDGWISGADCGCRKNIPYLPNVYNALENGKLITIQVIQIVDGKEIVSSVARTMNEMINLDGMYYSKLEILALNNFGC